ncbi:MAG: hypothetical protein HYV47_02000 [Candidatus Nealsonbacteria bacterium]|nr:hypothetical protein [Candidatus Nealsonbacteria bacterium]
MRKFLISLCLIFVIGAFLTVIPQGVSAEESENRPIWGRMEIVPKDDNHLGDIIIVKVQVFRLKSEVDFDHRQIPQRIKFPYFEIREAKYSSKKSGQYSVDIWELKIQSLVVVPPATYQIPAVLLQYKRKGVNYFSYFEIPGATISFTALSQPGSMPEPIIKEVAFGNKKRIIGLSLLSLGVMLILAGLAIFLRKRSSSFQKIIVEPGEIDEFMASHELIRQSLQDGGNVFLLLHKLYLLLRSFFREKRSIKLSFGWQENLTGDEKLLVQELQELYKKDYDKDLISKAHARELLDRAEKILKGG